jgi:hypothetical protein
MHTRISILFSAVFMTVMATGSSAQATVSDDGANEQSARISHHDDEPSLDL